MAYCNACHNSGWVDSKHHGAVVCPVCKAEGVLKGKAKKKDGYDQDSTWIKIISDAPVDFGPILEQEAKSFKYPTSIIVHFLFDRSVTPQGGLILEQMRLATITSDERRRLTEDELVSKGYILKDGKVRLVTDIPIGKFYCAWEAWKPVGGIVETNVDVNRKGDPLFMDDNMVAFAIQCLSCNQVKESLLELCEICKLRGVGTVLNAKLVANI